MEDFESPKLPISRPQDIAQVCCSKTLVAYSDAYLGMIYLKQNVLLAVVARYAPLPFAAHYAAPWRLQCVLCILRFWHLQGILHIHHFWHLLMSCWNLQRILHF
jgi:hypothetical protein